MPVRAPIRDSGHLPSRRQFLHTLGAGAGLYTVGSWLRPAFGKDTAASSLLIVRQESPFNAEPSLEGLLQSWITPVDRFFVRSHADIPTVDASKHRLRIEGLVDRPTEFSLDELKTKFKKAEVTATLTCAGNRRSEFKGGKIAGVQWQAGAIGNARWAGVSLADVLNAVGVQAEAKHLWFDGLDQVSHHEEKACFGGSIPLEKAMSGGGTVGALLATTMNDELLTPAHGAPLRTIVPGFIGARSVKWLAKIVVSNKPSPNHYVADAYKVVAEDTPQAQLAAAPIYQFVLNSAIGTLKDNGKLSVRGYALPSGGHGARIKQVDVSANDGKTWQKAKLEAPAADFCWQLWSAELAKPADAKSILVRAVDTTGATQPRQTPFNAKGYQYNGWHSVEL